MQRKNIERLSLLAIAILTVTLVATSIHYEREVGRQKALFYQLQLIRTAVQLYKSVRRDNPSSLETLASELYQFPGESIQRHYIEYPPEGAGSVFVDPFGTPYTYDSELAWVS
ncbi:MAG: type II secretion system protein GspG, partial [Deltaproteobacteria bacterium]|nr:type II secretion system protein GspG [Deltaproteobacteria bacterium]